MHFSEQYILSPFFIAKSSETKVPQLIQESISFLEIRFTLFDLIKYPIRKKTITNKGTIIFN